MSPRLPLRISRHKASRRRGVRREAESDARRNAHFAAIIESSQDAIVSKSLEGVIQSWNNAAERIFGYTAREVVGKPITILIPKDRLDEELDILARISSGQRIEHYETVRRRKDGTLLDVSLTISPIRDDSGKVIGASKIARDITEQKKAQIALQEARKQLQRSNDELEERVKLRTESLNRAMAQMEEFTYSVSHDLRAPLRAIKGYTLALKEDAWDKLGGDSQNYVDRIVVSADRMDRLIRDVLVYSRLAQSQVETSPVFLDQLVPDLISQFPELQPPNADIIITKPLLPVIGHASALTQAISNLLINAVKFVAPGVHPAVKVWTERRGNCVRLWVQDNGIGIPPEFHKKLFGLFERINESDKYKGTGIGLAIVRKAMEKMGGKAGVESDGSNGSSFWSELPAA